jgi:hypothetical protein
MTETIEPEWSDGLPLCTEDGCQSYDGKRCRVLGFRPDRFCEPALKTLRGSHDDLVVALKAVHARRIAWPAEIEAAVVAALLKAESPRE